MGLFTNLFGATIAPEVEAVPSSQPLSARDLDRCDFHITRFTLALQQFDKAKGDARRAELSANLAYWVAVKAARDAKPEGMN